MPDQTSPMQAILNEAFRQIKDSMQRIRILEERTKMLEEKVQSLQDTLLKDFQESRQDNTKLKESLTGLDIRLAKMENDMLKLSRGLEKTAKQGEVEELKQLVSLYSPFKKEKG